MNIERYNRDITLVSKVIFGNKLLAKNIVPISELSKPIPINTASFGFSNVKLPKELLESSEFSYTFKQESVSIDMGFVVSSGESQFLSLAKVTYKNTKTEMFLFKMTVKDNSDINITAFRITASLDIDIQSTLSITIYRQTTITNINIFTKLHDFGKSLINVTKTKIKGFDGFIDYKDYYKLLLIINVIIEPKADKKTNFDQSIFLANVATDCDVLNPSMAIKNIVNVKSIVVSCNIAPIDKPAILVDISFPLKCGHRVKRFVVNSEFFPVVVIDKVGGKDKLSQVCENLGKIIDELPKSVFQSLDSLPFKK